MAAVALITRDGGVAAVRVVEVDGVLRTVDGDVVELLDVVVVYGLPELDEPAPMIVTS